jgi:hypothetical protein
MEQEWRYWNETNKSGVTGLNQTRVALLEGIKQEWRYWNESDEWGYSNETRVALLE